MATIYDLVTAADVVAYWTEKNQNAQPLLGATLFPVKKRLGTKLEWVKGANNQPVALRPSSFDAKAIRRDRKGIEKVSTEMPFFKESMYVDEKMRQDLNNMIANNNQAVADQILINIYDDESSLIDSSEIALERMRMELLTTGQIVISGNGQSYTYNYGLDTATQKVTVIKAWSDPTADIIGDIIDIVEKAKARGITITRAVCNSTTAKYFRTNTAIKNAVYVFANGTVPVTTARAIEYIKNETGVTFYAYDNVYVDEAGTTHKYVSDNTVTFLPDGDLGFTNLGTTPEESDLMNSVNTADVSIVNQGVAVTTSKIVDPVNVETKVSMIGLPSFEMADKIVILDTHKD
jgi:hypothetical protein|nr:MAG TPA: Major capsid protein [Caudoviricetes sp.]